MDRLTKWNGQKYVLPQGKTSDGESYWRIIADRLAAYEDTGLMPEEIDNKSDSDIDIVVDYFKNKYKYSETQAWIKSKIAWSLYETWKWAERKFYGR